MSGVVDVSCGGCPVWWMSGVVDVPFYSWCGGCLAWWMSDVVGVRCGGCLVRVDVLFYPCCGGCLVWWMSGVVNVCVVDVVQSPKWWRTRLFYALRTFGCVLAIFFGLFSQLNGQNPKNEIAPCSLCL